MEPLNEEAINIFILNVRRLIQLDKIKEALQIMEQQFSPISSDLADSILINSSSLTSLNKEIENDIIAPENARVKTNHLKMRLLNLMARIPEEIEVQRITGSLKKSSLYTASSDKNLEKILGDNNLLKINWLEKGIQASKSVCQVITSTGAKGTGFVLKGGYLMTNFHVLSNSDTAANAKIVFDFEEDLLGNMRKTSEFFLDATDVAFSPVKEFDYAYVKIKDPENKLSQWGYLEIETFVEPQVNNPVTIIQHPSGGTKHIALTANQIIAIDGKKLFYETDTERGSSGSPVFNKDWKVIALHHAGKTEEDGGLIINAATGERRGANEGILIKDIAVSIGKAI